MRLQQQVFDAYKKHVEEHMPENRAGGLAMKEMVEASPLNYKGVLDKTVHIPKVFDEETVRQFREISATTYRIFGKVIKAYRENAEVRALFPFSKELEDLILLPAQYDSHLPIARFDIFYNEETGDFQFCEINTDGTAAMIRDVILRQALIHNPAHQAVAESFELEPFELFDTWVKTFMSLYETYPKRKAAPHVALVDFLENATFREFEEFRDRFEKAGVSCGIYDIRSLKYEDGVLKSEDGQPIDAIYRRVVTADVMDHYDEVTAFLNAVRDDAVFLAGAFETQIIHTKWLFYVLHHPLMKQYLTDEEQAYVAAHVPMTVEFSPEYIDLETVLMHKDDYILKPMDAYASKGIYAAGREYAQDAWETLVSGLYGKGMICQQYCRQYLTDNIDFGWGDGEWHPYMNMPGLYTYNGVFAGILMRMACEENIIVAHENERTAPVFVVK